MGEPKNFFKIKRQFGHAPTKSFANPGLLGTEKSVPHLDYLTTSRMELYWSRSETHCGKCFCSEDTPDGTLCDFKNRWL